MILNFDVKSYMVFLTPKLIRENGWRYTIKLLALKVKYQYTGFYGFRVPFHYPFPDSVYKIHLKVLHEVLTMKFYVLLRQKNPNKNFIVPVPRIFQELIFENNLRSLPIKRKFESRCHF